MRKISARRTRLKVGFKGIVNSKSEAVLGFEYAKNVKNFVIENGVLTGELGIDKFQGRFPLPSLLRHDIPSFPDGKTIRNLYVQEHPQGQSHDMRVIAHLEDNSFWYCNVFEQNEGWQQIENLYINDEVSAVNYRYNDENLFIIASPNYEMLIIENSTPFVYRDAPHFTCVTSHNGRVFGAINQKARQVWYSSFLNPLDWKEDGENSGYIELGEEVGDIIKLESFLNYLFIFCENGIYRLTAYGDPNEFVLKKVFSDTGYIYKHSIVQCADKIIFLAEEGLYQFDGYSSVRIGKELPPIFNKHIVSACYLNDVYYLTCNLVPNGTATPQNDTLVCYTVSNGEFGMISGVSVKGLKTIKSYHLQEAICFFNGENKNKIGQVAKSGGIFSSPTSKLYQSPVNTLDSGKIKVVRDVSILTKHPLTLTITLDGERYDYPLEGRSTPQTVIVERGGKVVGFELASSDANAYVEPFVATVEEVE